MSDPLPDPVSPQTQAVLCQAGRLARLPQPPWLHQEVARRLASKLEVIRLQPAQWLDWGGFLGAGADLVSAAYPQSQRWVLEPTPALAQRSRDQWRQARATPWWAPWRRETDPVTCLGDAQSPAWADGGVQMLWANMTLHAHPDLPSMLGQWSQALSVGGFLMCSGLGPDTARELRQLYQSLGWPVPTIHFIDMHDLGDAMLDAGFTDPVMDMERITLTWASAEELLAELRTWGGNVAHGRHPGLRTPRWRQKLLEALNRHLMNAEGRLALTVELVFGHAIKAAPKAKLAPETRVSLSDMKSMIKHSSPKS